MPMCISIMGCLHHRRAGAAGAQAPCRREDIAHAQCVLRIAVVMVRSFLRDDGAPTAPCSSDIDVSAPSTMRERCRSNLALSSISFSILRVHRVVPFWCRCRRLHSVIICSCSCNRRRRSGLIAEVNAGSIAAHARAGIGMSRPHIYRDGRGFLHPRDE